MSLKVKALQAKYEAQKLEALATLEVYMANSVGIGEHPQIMDEMDKLVKSIADADGCIATINAVFIDEAKTDEVKTAESVNN